MIKICDCVKVISWKHRMQPLQPVSIKLVISVLRIRIVKAFRLLTDLSAVDSLHHSLGPKNADRSSHKNQCCF